jgi:hypothetical protein
MNLAALVDTGRAPLREGIVAPPRPHENTAHSFAGIIRAGARAALVHLLTIPDADLLLGVTAQIEHRATTEHATKKPHNPHYAPLREAG